MKSSSQYVVPPVIPDHQLLRRIGQGAYGEIWLARNVIGTYRAVKIVSRAQFDNAKPYEREFIGLQTFEPVSRSHPGLMDILQVGRNEDAGYIYYVMELADDEVAGSRIHPDTYSARTLSRDLARRGRLPADESVHIAIKLAAALAHLHAAGLVHRDIKPSNIIFVDGEPKLADVGLVVSLADARTFVGSEGYIPPEGPGTFQADIYSLGKVLYEISTGQDRDLFPELPPEISTFTDCAEVAELNEVVVKACANDPQARYGSACELLADLEMILAGRSVKRLHFVERQLSRVRRIAIGAVALAVAAGILAIVVNRVRQREKELLANAYVANGTEFVTDGNPHAALPWFAQALRLQQSDPAAAEAHRIRIGTILQRTPKLIQFWEQNSPILDLRFSPDGRTLAAAEHRRMRLLDIATGEKTLEFDIRHTIHAMAFTPDGARIAVGHGNYLAMFDAVTGTNIFEVKQPEQVFSIDFSSDGETVLIGCGDHCAHFLSASDGKERGELGGHKKGVTSAVFSPDGTRVLTGGRDGTARLWDVATRECLAVMPHAEWVQGVAFSPDGQRLASASSDHTILIWQIGPTPLVTARMEHRSNVQRIQFSPDGRMLVSAAMDHTVRFWDVATGKPAGPTLNMPMPVLSAAIGPEGRRVACAGQSGRIQIWDVAAELPLHVGDGVMSGNDERYVTFASNVFRIWNARDHTPVTKPLHASRSIHSAACSGDAGTILLSTASDEAAMDAVLYDVRTGAERKLTPLPKKPVIAITPSGDTILTATSRVALVWSSLTGKLLFEPIRCKSSVLCASFSPDGRVLALGARTYLLVFDSQSGTQRFALQTGGMEIRALAFTADSSRLVSATADDDYNVGEATVWDVSTGRALGKSALHTDGIVAASVSHDGTTVVTGGEDSYVFLSDAATGRPRIDPLPLAWQLRSVGFSSDDRWVIAASRYETAVWEVRTGRALIPVFRIPQRDLFTESGFCAGGRQIWMRSLSGLQFMDLPRAAGDPDEVFAAADQLGIAIPDTFQWSTNAITAAKRRQMCDIARARTEATMVSWHLQEAELAERDEAWLAAQFHWSQLMKRSPDDPAIRGRLEIARSHQASLTVPANGLANP